MIEIFAVVAAIGTFLFGSRIGRDIGRKEVLIELRAKMADCVQNQAGRFSNQGIRGGIVIVDYFGGSPHGVGYVDGTLGAFMVVNIEDMEAKFGDHATNRQVGASTSPNEDETDDTADSNTEFVQELDQRIAEMSRDVRQDKI